MGSKIFKSILDEKIDNFRFAFQNTAKDIFWNEIKQQITHPGEYGIYRESVAKELLRLIIPGRLEIGNGFLINDKGGISTQCDIIVFDKNATPLIQNNERQRFFPVETVCCIGEIKSDLDKQGLKSALNKFSKNKAIRLGMTTPTPIKRERSGAFDPSNFAYDNLFSFVICNKFTFDIIELHNELDSFYEPNTPHWLKHNLILSINDGLLAYLDHKGVTFPYPSIPGINFKNKFIPPDHNPNLHFHFFCSFLFMGTTSGSLFYPEISNYLNNLV